VDSIKNKDKPPNVSSIMKYPNVEAGRVSP